MESNDTSVRILDLLFELTYAERGRSRSQIRRLTHYRKLSDTAFDSAFTRDKETLKKIGVDIEVKPRGDELIYRLRRSDPELLKLSLEEVSLLDLASTAWNEPSTTELASTKLRASSAANRKSTIDFHLSGAEHVLPLFQALRIEVLGEPIIVLWNHGTCLFLVQQFIFKAMTLTEAMNAVSGFHVFCLQLRC